MVRFLRLGGKAGTFRRRHFGCQYTNHCASLITQFIGALIGWRGSRGRCPRGPVFQVFPGFSRHHWKTWRNLSQTTGFTDINVMSTLIATITTHHKHKHPFKLKPMLCQNDFVTKMFHCMSCTFCQLRIFQKAFPQSSFWAASEYKGKTIKSGERDVAKGNMSQYAQIPWDYQWR